MTSYDEAAQTVVEAKAKQLPLIVVQAKISEIDDENIIANSDVIFECPNSDLAVGMLASAIFGIANQLERTPDFILDKISAYIRRGTSIL